MYVDIFNTSKTYNVIYADPPWQYGSKAYQDGNRDMLKLEQTQYETLSQQEIEELPVARLSDKDCALFLWVVDSHIPEGIIAMERWGFRYTTVAFHWIKKTATGSTCVNFAPWLLKSSELCLLGIKGRMGKWKGSNKVRGLIEAERTKHSKKPDEARNRIVELFPEAPKIELFARDVDSKHWDWWGAEAPQ